MTNALELKVVFAAIDKFSASAKAINKVSGALAKELKAAKDAFKDLEKQQGLVDSFRSTNKALGIAGNDLKAARERVEEMAKAMQAAGVPSTKMQRDFKTATEEARNLSAQVNRLTEKKQRLRGELSAVGIDTKKLSEHQRTLKGQMADATAAVEKQTAAIEKHNKVQQRIHAMRAEIDTARQKSRALMTKGAGIAAGGAAMSIPVVKATQEYADFETAMLGVARQVDGVRDANGKLTASYFEIGEAIKAMSERLPMAAKDIAAIVEGGARMGIQGKENLLIYAEATAVMADAFSLPAERIGEDIGKISNLYNVPIKDIRRLGDTLNWLDDNAQSKGADIIDVMQRIAGTVTTAGMSYKEAAALGSTFLSLGSSAEVAASASQAMIRELSIANMQSKRFREGAKMLGLDLKQLQKSASIDPTGTIIRVMEAINKLPNEKRIEAATRIFGKEYGDDASKLAGRLDEYRRQLALVNDEHARGSMQREADARNDTLGAKQTMTGNAGTNVMSSIGEIFAPEVKASLDWLKSMVQGFRDWAKENPALSSGLATVFKWIAFGATAIGTLIAAFGAVVVPLAIMKLSLVQLGLSGNPVIVTLSTVASKIWAVISPVGKLTAAFAAGYAAGTLLNEGLDWMISKLAGYETSLGGFIFDVIEKFKNASWGEIGMWIIKGIEWGINALTGGLYGLIKKVTVGMAGAAKEALSIKSPSRVFAEIGAYTMQGLEQGISGNEDGPLSAIGATAKKLAAIGSGVAIGTAPLAAGAAPGGMGGNTYQITIHAQSGTDSQGLAALVAREIERIEAGKAAKQRSRLRDWD